ncbi:MAG: heme exporter protein CcmB [Rhodospirillaceae bacterium]|nr:heme exporter protein CcmB [Rhodospirillaceae bacterium]|tara:strand:+ start:10985 stop:11683 length:699 start_codon:yes stop_codon:yes gene_type:complete
MKGKNYLSGNNSASFVAIFKRDIRLALRNGIGSFIAVIFFVITVTLFPLAVGPELNLLTRVAPGVLWVCALLSTMLSLDSLFREDFEDGNLEQIVLGVLPLELVVLSKAFAHWVTTGLPLIICAPVLAVLLNMSGKGFIVLILSLLLGTPALSMIGTVGAALTVSLRRGGVLIALLVLPLSVPILIFGVGAVEGAIFGLGERSPLLILAGGFVASLVLAPIASAAALKMAVE